MSYHLSEGLFVIIVTLIPMYLALFLTRKAPWLLKEKILLLIATVCYILDTVWWAFGLHFLLTDIYFKYQGHTLQLTIFFVTCFVTFIWLIVSRVRGLMGKRSR